MKTKVNYRLTVKTLKQNKKIQNFPELEQKIESHLIGKLQTNKVNKAVGTFDFIHTVDTVRLAIKIDSRAHQI